jgi:predicted transcriptional regulator
MCRRVFEPREALVSLEDAQAAVKAVDHPIRQSITAQLAANGELSPSQIAEKTGIDLGTVSYHVAVLRETVPPILKRTKSVPNRGAIQNFYELVGAV